jgi:hypothetical protein
MSALIMNTAITTIDLADLLGMITRNVRDLYKRGNLVHAGKEFALVPAGRS